MVSRVEEARNFECFLSEPFDFSTQPRVLIFFDNKLLASDVAKHLNSQLPPEYCGTGVVRHYHGRMSSAYLETVHTAFTEEDGRCKIMCATSGESVVCILILGCFRVTIRMQGVDFADVKIVCNAGLPSDIVEALQRGG